MKTIFFHLFVVNNASPGRSVSRFKAENKLNCGNLKMVFTCYQGKIAQLWASVCENI